MNGKKPAEIAAGMINAAGKYFSAYVGEESEGADNLCDLKKTAAFWLRGAACTAAAYLLGGAELVFGSRPFGIALFCVSVKYCPFTFIGALLAMLNAPSAAIPGALALGASLAARFFISRRYPTDARPYRLIRGTSLAWRMIHGALTGFAVSLCRLIRGGFIYYDLFSMIFETVTVPVCVLAYSGAAMRSKRFTMQYEIAVMSLLMSGVWALRGVELAGFSFSAAVTMFLTMYITRTGGVLRGALAGLLCGLACSVPQAPMFALSALTFGFTARVSLTAGAVAATAVAGAYGVFTAGVNSLWLTLPDIAAGAAIYTPLEKLRLLPRLNIFGNSHSASNDRANEMSAARLRERDATERISLLSDSMAKLGEVFGMLAERNNRPRMYDIKRAGEEVLRGYCAGCKNNPVCWKDEYLSTDNALEQLAASVKQRGTLTAESLPEYFKSRCKATERIASDINGAYAGLFEAAARQNKAEVFALDYRSVAELLAGAAEEGSSEFRADPALGARARDAARYIGFCASSIGVWGDRRKYLIAGGVSLAGIGVGAEDLRHAFERALGCVMTPPSFEMDGEYLTMTMRSDRLISAENGTASRSRDGEEVCGDTVVCFEGRGDYAYALISDGMGSGRDAAMASGICGVIMRKLLEAGCRPSSALKLLNNFIRCGGEENSATVDLLEIDLLSGTSRFIKSGAAASFVLRDGAVFRIESPTIPLGIARTINAEQTEFTLKNGDVVVMVSDGVAEDFAAGIKLADVLTYSFDTSLPASVLASALLPLGPGADDASIAVVKIAPAR